MRVPSAELVQIPFALPPDSPSVLSLALHKIHISSQKALLTRYFPRYLACVRKYETGNNFASPRLPTTYCLYSTSSVSQQDDRHGGHGGVSLWIPQEEGGCMQWISNDPLAGTGLFAWAHSLE